MKVIAYQLERNLDHIPKRFPRGDIERYDASIYPKNILKNWDLIDTSEFTGVIPVSFLGWLNRLSKTDYPRNIPGIPLMSKKMLNVLTEIDDFPHQAISTCIIDYQFKHLLENYSMTENLESNICNSNYFAVKLLEHLDLIDRERSEFESYSTDPDFPPYVRHLVIRESQQSLPPIFRIDGDPVLLFVSPIAKESLEHSNIQGIRFLAYGEDGILDQTELAA